MSEPIRYTSKTEGSVLGSPHWEHPEGEWVNYEDYARLKAEVERLTKAGDELASTLVTHFPCRRSMELENEWDAAKEGKQS